jgi:hypothetical protein
MELWTGKVLPHMEMSVWGRVGSAFIIENLAFYLCEALI